LTTQGDPVSKKKKKKKTKNPKTKQTDLWSPVGSSSTTENTLYK
jgi:hypothetical protein